MGTKETNKFLADGIQKAKGIEPGDLEKINQYTRREMKEDELYIFRAVVCDNEIDRDYERFSDAALGEIAQNLLGKTIIMDHSPSAENQIARVYNATVENTGDATSQGDPYRRVVMSCYMPVTAENEAARTAIDAGIRKEVSIGCAVTKKVCSICGADKNGRDCHHRAGRSYKGRMCYDVLDGIADVYEVSFVAIPAQPAAGVTKSKGKFNGAEDIEKQLELERWKIKLLSKI